MKRPLITLLTSFLMALPLTVIQATDSDTDSKHKDTITLCGQCGHVKGTEACCDTSHEVHSCGAHKGSPACCKIKLTGQDVTLCNHCGQVQGAGECCASDVAKCKGCGLAKGSPGCCVKAPEHREEKEHKDHHDGHE